MLVSPDYKMKEFRNHSFSDRVSAAATEMHTFVLILMKYQYVEPFVLVTEWSLKLYFFIFESNIQSLVFHVTNAVERNFGLTFDKKYWDNFNILNIRHLTEIINVVITIHQIDITQVLQSTRVVMISMNHKNGHGDAQIFVHVIRIVELVSFEFYILFAENTLVEHLLKFEESFS